MTGGGGLRVDTPLCRGLVSTALGLNSFLTRPPNRFTLPRNVRLPTEILAPWNVCSCSSPCDRSRSISNVTSSAGKVCLCSSWDTLRSSSGMDGLLRDGWYVPTLSTLRAPGQLLESDNWSRDEDGEGKASTAGEKCAESGERGSRRSRRMGDWVLGGVHIGCCISIGEQG